MIKISRVQNNSNDLGEHILFKIAKCSGNPTALINCAGIAGKFGSDSLIISLGQATMLPKNVNLIDMLLSMLSL